MEPYYKDEYVTIYHGDCREIVPQLQTVDAVVTDPPYNVLDTPWDKEDVFTMMLPSLCNIAEEFIAFFGQMPSVLSWLNMINMYAQFLEHVVWVKRIKTPAKRLSRTHESVFIFATGKTKRFYKTKGPWSDVTIPGLLTGACDIEGIDRHIKDLEAKVFGKSSGDNSGKARHELYDHYKNAISDRSSEYANYSNVWSFLSPAHRTRNDANTHPTQKPLNVCERLVEMLTKDCHTVVLDPCAGIGTTGMAAKNLNRQAVLIEKEEQYCEIAANRMRQEVLPLHA